MYFRGKDFLSFEIKEELASTRENHQIVKRHMLTFQCRDEGNWVEEVVEGQIPFHFI
jgi:hypothetical protein